MAPSVAVGAVYGLQAAVAPAVAAQKRHREASLQAGTDQGGAELQVAHHQDLIQQRQRHPLVFLSAGSHHQLFTIKAGAAIGTQQVEAAHQRFGRRRVPGSSLLEIRLGLDAFPWDGTDPSSHRCNTPPATPQQKVLAVISSVSVITLASPSGAINSTTKAMHPFTKLIKT
jgi:hypothetical protein